MKKYFVLASRPSANFGNTWSFISIASLRRATENPKSARRFYSAKKACAALLEADPNPHMHFGVHAAHEDRDGIHISDTPYAGRIAKKNPYPKKTANKDFFVLGGFFPGRHLPVYLTSGNTLDDDSKKARRFASISGAEKLIAKALIKYPSASKWLVFRGKMRDGHLGVYFPPTQGETAHKKNPSPGLRERSDRLHKLRLKVLSLVRKAEKFGNTPAIDAARRKLHRVDRMISDSASNFFSRRAKKRK